MNGPALGDDPRDHAPDDVRRLAPRPVDAAALLALVDQQRSATEAALEPDARLLYGTWGLAWLLGFGALYATNSASPLVGLPEVVGGVVFAALLVLAVVVTAVHSARRTSGVRGISSRVGAMYGWSWVIGFAAAGVIFSAVVAAGADAEVMRVLSPALSCLVVALLYLAGGALWQDWTQFGLGVWIAVSAAAGALAGWPENNLVMALAGGGGFLLAAGWFHQRDRSRS